ncbi:12554_t:CDS:2, partial [Racocetra fulgida]
FTVDELFVCAESSSNENKVMRKERSRRQKISEILTWVHINSDIDITALEGAHNYDEQKVYEYLLKNEYAKQFNRWLQQAAEKGHAEAKELYYKIKD